MEIREISYKNIWESFLLPLSEKTFMNSWNWGDFYHSLGNKIWRFGIYDHGNLLALTLAIKKDAKAGKHIFFPYAPIFDENKLSLEQKKEILSTVLTKAKEIGLQENVWFLRFGPIVKNTQDNKKIFSDLGFINAPVFVHPEVTWILDVQKNEDTLLKEMRKTTRYMIRQAQKAGVEIIHSTQKSDIELYNKLYLSTVSRHNFTPFSVSYLEKELATFVPDNQVEIIFAKYQDKIISGAMIIYWQGSAYYHQGASDNSQFPKIGCSYLLQWAIIEEAKKRNCQFYNFWGIVNEMQGLEDLNNAKFKNHPWYGLSLFKMGFGGVRKQYLQTQDYPLKSLYWITNIFETLRRKVRGL